MGGALTPAGDALAEVQLALGQQALDRGEHADALGWFRSAARSGDARAYNMLGRCFECGWGVEPDPAQAAGYYAHAAEAGDVWAMFNLADLFGRGHGVPEDAARALELYAEAARRGHGKSLNMIGLMHEEGRAVPADRETARDFYRAGAESGDCWAQFNLARLLIEDGAIDAALPLLERTLETGFPDFWNGLAKALQGQADARLRAFLARLEAVRAN